MAANSRTASDKITKAKTQAKTEYEKPLEEQLGKIDLNKEESGPQVAEFTEKPPLSFKPKKKSKSLNIHKKEQELSAELTAEPKLPFKPKKELKLPAKLEKKSKLPSKNKSKSSGIGKSKKESAYEADSENDGENRKFRERLILGEADFSYTKSLIREHENDLPQLPTFITATEVRDDETLQKKYNDYKDNIGYIKSKGGKIVLEVDAKNIQGSFPNKRFERIHFNAPYLKNKAATRDLVSNFFTSAQQVQNDGDRVHISLVDTNQYFWHGATYGLIEASAQAGYKLLTKRNFGNSRYNGYDHRETDLDSKSKNAQFLKEFVFEKTTLSPDAINAEYKALGILSESTESFGLFRFFHKNENNSTPYDTASDSSDYFIEKNSAPTPTPNKRFSKK